MKYVAKPFKVHAHAIVKVGLTQEKTGILPLTLACDVVVKMRPEQLHRFSESLAEETVKFDRRDAQPFRSASPLVGDYYVVSPSGHVYLASKSSFERMYRPAPVLTENDT
jgi:hypothetical protein